MIQINQINKFKKTTALFTVTALAFLAVLPITPSYAARKDLSGVKIVVDPGHGGHDSGALGPSGLRESETNLSIAKYLRNDLKNAKAKVIMTRETDTFIPLDERANIANRHSADRFVSIHLNSAGNPTADRTETYFQKPSAAKLAARVQRKMVGDLNSKNGGSLNADFAVIRQTNMPGILTESAFISNPRQEARLKKASYKRKIARAIFKGIEADYGIKKPVATEQKPVQKPAPATPAPNSASPAPIVTKAQPIPASKPAVSKPVKTVPVVKNNKNKSLLSRAVEGIFSNILPPVGTKPVVKHESKVQKAAKPETAKQEARETQQEQKPELMVANTTSLPLLNPVTTAGSATKLEAAIISPVLTKPVVIRNMSEKSMQPQVKLYDTTGKKVADIKPVLLRHKGLKIHPSNLTGGNEFTGSIQITAPKAQIKTPDTETVAQ